MRWLLAIINNYLSAEKDSNLITQETPKLESSSEGAYPVATIQSIVSDGIVSPSNTTLSASEAENVAAVDETPSQCPDQVEEMLAMLQGLSGKLKKVSNEVERIREGIESAENRKRLLNLNRHRPPPGFEEGMMRPPNDHDTTAICLDAPDHGLAEKDALVEGTNNTLLSNQDDSPDLEVKKIDICAPSLLGGKSMMHMLGKLANLQRWRI
ncbi:hypothetical protein H0H87_012149 [Tephrocybe sp. NHM501043]|nr:hypothetical protein H0H87_012149 [Tephrocybe sp. NHM501043]